MSCGAMTACISSRYAGRRCAPMWRRPWRTRGLRSPASVCTYDDVLGGCARRRIGRAASRRSAAPLHERRAAELFRCRSRRTHRAGPRCVVDRFASGFVSARRRSEQAHLYARWIARRSRRGARRRLERAQDVRVEPDGVFGYARTIVDPKTLQARVERAVVGRVALARFPAGTQLQRVDGTHARPAANVVPFVGTPNDGHFSAIFPQRRAIGRIDPDSAIARLQDAYLALRAMGALERTKNGLIRGALDLVK